MDAWSIGLLVLVVVGLAAVIFGALYDRARNRRRAVEMLAPPPRAIPQFRADAPAPRYLSELQARRPSGIATTGLSTADRAEVGQLLRDDSTQRFAVGYASADFVTDAESGWAVLDDPVVLVCADEVSSIRELLGLLERVVLARRSLVLVAPAMPRDVLATLEVNRIQRRLSLVVVLTEDAAVAEGIARSCGARLTERGDRQAGYLPPSDVGECRRWVSTARESRLVPAGPHPG